MTAPRAHADSIVARLELKNWRGGVSVWAWQHNGNTTATQRVSRGSALGGAGSGAHRTALHANLEVPKRTHLNGVDAVLDLEDTQRM